MPTGLEAISEGQQIITNYQQQALKNQLLALQGHGMALQNESMNFDNAVRQGMGPDFYRDQLHTALQLNQAQLQTANTQNRFLPAELTQRLQAGQEQITAAQNENQLAPLKRTALQNELAGQQLRQETGEFNLHKTQEIYDDVKTRYNEAYKAETDPEKKKAMQLYGPLEVDNMTQHLDRMQHNALQMAIANKQMETQLQLGAMELDAKVADNRQMRLLHAASTPIAAKALAAANPEDKQMQAISDYFDQNPADVIKNQTPPERLMESFRAAGNEEGLAGLIQASMPGAKGPQTRTTTTSNDEATNSFSKTTTIDTGPSDLARNIARQMIEADRAGTKRSQNTNGPTTQRLRSPNLKLITGKAIGDAPPGAKNGRIHMDGKVYTVRDGKLYE